MIEEQQMLTAEQKQEIISTYGKSDSDTGSSEVQIALLTAKITDLSEHFKTNHLVPVRN